MLKNLVLLSLLFSLILSAPSATDNLSERRHNLENFRDTINGDVPTVSKRKTKKYKCYVVEEDDDDDNDDGISIIDSSPSKKNSQVNLKKFIYTDEEEAANNGETLPVLPVQTVHPAPPVVQSSINYQPQPIETISESEAAVEFEVDSYQKQQQLRNKERLVTIPPATPSPVGERPKLKRVHLPLAHPTNVNPEPATVEVTTIPPDVVTAKRDSQNRPLILAPEHCDQIKYYANMYGVTDTKEWVHNNCNFAQMYLPTASCEEIDILVGSCDRSYTTTSSTPVKS